VAVDRSYAVGTAIGSNATLTVPGDVHSDPDDQAALTDSDSTFTDQLTGDVYDPAGTWTLAAADGTRYSIDESSTSASLNSITAADGAVTSIGSSGASSSGYGITIHRDGNNHITGNPRGTTLT